MMAALKSLPDNPSNWFILGVGISSFSFLTQFVIFLVFGMMAHFLLYPRHFDYYVRGL